MSEDSVVHTVTPSSNYIYPDLH
uniref:Uncharacterized protein n=1 Tax=Arundo donax TaxID=35708 RepID=A0A0A8XVR7_ARUDO